MKIRLLVISATILCLIFTSCGSSDKNDNYEQLNTTLIETTTVAPSTTAATTVIDALPKEWEQGAKGELITVEGITEGIYDREDVVDGYLKVEIACLRRRAYDNSIRDGVDFFLYLDGTRVIENPCAMPGNIFDITVTEEDGNVFTVQGGKLIRGARSVNYQEYMDENKIINAMMNNDVLVFKITQENSSYDFTLNCAGFEETFNSIDWDI